MKLHSIAQAVDLLHLCHYYIFNDTLTLVNGDRVAFYFVKAFAFGIVNRFSIVLHKHFDTVNQNHHQDFHRDF